MKHMKSTKKLTTEIFIHRSRDTHNNFYDYSISSYKNSSTKIHIICPIHGEFTQKPADHMNGRGCQKCGNFKNTRKKSLEFFLLEANKKHNDFYDYSKVHYQNANTKIEIICPKHGSFLQIPYCHISGQGCPKCGILKSKESLRKNTEDFIKKAVVKHGNKYDYSKVDYVNNKKEVIIICPTHGEFTQKPNSHLINGGCNKCGNQLKGISKRLSKDIFIQKAKKIHGYKYDYSMVDYVKNNLNVDIVCPKHGIFDQYPGNHLMGSGCPRCSSTESKSEIKIKTFLNDLGIDYVQHDRSIIAPFEIDFIIPSHKIAIEFNGIYYHSENIGKKDKKYHLNKTELCEKHGYRLIHIFENEFLQKNELIKFKLKSILGKNKYKIYARKCRVEEISYQTKKKFNEKYHIQDDSQSCINLGLFHKNRLVQVMTFSKRRKALGSKHIEGEYELSRMSSIKGFTIIGGASKLLKYFETNYNPKKLISYADRRWSKGDVYFNMGFNFIRNTPPNYWYFYNKKSNKYLFHRYKFAKHTLNNQLEKFDNNLSEWENMKNNHYDRIWDSGNMLFEKIYK